MGITRISLLGHKDHGKSTLIGNLLIATNSVTEQRINDAKKTSKKLGRQFEPGYILDSFVEERENEMTIDTTRAQIRYKDSGFEFIDVPGHEELIKNMISGASYADFAVLIVSAKPGEGIKDQTRRHLFLARMLGMKKVIIAVNKMDTVGYGEKEFSRISRELSVFLVKIGFSGSGMHFVPISAYLNENLVKKSGKMRWYKGDSLIETMYSIAEEPSRSAGKKLRVVLQGRLEDGSIEKIAGKIISGTLRSNMKVNMVPGSAYVIKELFVKGKKSGSARRGENVAIVFDKKINGEARGRILCGEKDGFKASNSINALVFFTSKLVRKPMIRLNGFEVSAKMKVKNSVSVVTGEAEPKKKITKLGAANVELLLSGKVPSEPFDDTPELGRFVLYDGNEFAGIGIIN